MAGNYNKKLISNGMLGALVAIIALLLVFAILLSVFIIVAKPFSKGGAEGSGNKNGESYPFRQQFNFSVPSFSSDAVAISSADIKSERAAVLNLTDNQIIASRQSENIIYPASMTKVMTLIVVYENITSESDLNKVLTISETVQKAMEAEESSGFGLKAGDKLTVKDLIYDMILKSDNIACVTLAEYISGSEAEFVKLMNQKARDMGLEESKTLFQNCTGLHHRYHYTTCKDMATIMSYAMKNTFCAEILTAKSYKPSNNFRPGDGCTFWNSFLVTDNYGLKDGKVQPKTAKILAGKTGYTPESGSCLVIYAKGNNGKEYIVVTSNATTPATRLEDHLYLCNTYIK